MTPDIFESAIFLLRILKICVSTNRDCQQSMHRVNCMCEFGSKFIALYAALCFLSFFFLFASLNFININVTIGTETVECPRGEEWIQFCHVIGLKDTRIRPSTQFRILSVFKNVLSGERIQNPADSRGCGFKRLRFACRIRRICVDGRRVRKEKVAE